MVSFFQALGAYVAEHPVAIVLCVVAYMVIGFVWYGPLFSKPWTKLAGIDMSKKAKQKDMMKAMAPAMLISLVSGFFFAFVIGLFVELFGPDAESIFIIITMLWLAFTALPMAQSYAYTKKSIKL